MIRLLVTVCFAVCLIAQEIPAPPGKLVDLGEHRLHVNCSGNSGPAVVVELGLGDFSFEWVLVQNEVAPFTRICTYDRAGHAWSDPGPQPRTYAQINLELRDALRKLGMRGPYVLVGHSFGGPVVRQFAADYPKDVAGMVFVDTVHEDQRVVIQGKAVQLRATADGRPIPPAREKLTDAERTVPKPVVRSPGGTMSAPLDRLPPAEQLEADRVRQQKELAELSTNGTQKVLKCGHNMHLECPGDVVGAIKDVVERVRKR
jgi:pimeloyl-ACP methyl ester carboxylesterase